MSRRLDEGWLVFDSVENRQHDRCLDLFSRPDGSYGFEEFRRDPEDGGGWTPVAYHSAARFETAAAASAAATEQVPWLAEALTRR
ncbi:hypothetical protein [Thalassobaculum salexigens]|uniref:hypothetical protein n=1 Tax=Thalassobaculum salexigens TaxID=455360 RepID=UPI00248E5B83|nr:hypothetical protein [Thalassobaculum salexigens]